MEMCLFFIFQGKLLLLDFNPFGRVTDGLLYTWEELEGDDLLPADDMEHHVIP